jgi:TonB family protein
MKLPRFQQLTILAVLLLLTISFHALGAEPDVTVPKAVRHLMLSQPKPEYPGEARLKHITGRGVYDIIVHSKSGVVAQVKISQSTGSKLLDDAAVRALSRWRARPGMISRIKVPVTFTM